MTRGRYVLALGTEWSSGHGGLSTFHRELCRAWAAEYPEDSVFCLVPQASSAEVEAARHMRVVLVPAVNFPGLSIDACLCMPPVLDKAPDIVIGHGRVTGPAARAQTQHFPGSHYVHFIHVAPEEVEPFKSRRHEPFTRRGEERTSIEIALARQAAVVCAVGPRLTRVYGTELSPYDVQVLQFDPGLPETELSKGPPPGIQVLVIGRAEDRELKGLDLAVRALARVNRSKLESTPWLTIRGAPPGEGDALHTALRGLTRPPLDIRVREYSSDGDLIAKNICASSLMLMPSRAEGFGLVALEATAAGVPVLVSEQSGVADVIAEFSKSHIVPVTSDPEIDESAWGSAIEDVLSNREAAFIRANALRTQLAKRLSWTRGLNALVAALPGEGRRCGVEVRSTVILRLEGDMCTYGPEQLAQTLDVAFAGAEDDVDVLTVLPGSVVLVLTASEKAVQSLRDSLCDPVKVSRLRLIDATVRTVEGEITRLEPTQLRGRLITYRRKFRHATAIADWKSKYEPVKMTNLAADPDLLMVFVRFRDLTTLLSELGKAITTGNPEYVELELGADHHWAFDEKRLPLAALEEILAFFGERRSR